MCSVTATTPVPSVSASIPQVRALCPALHIHRHEKTLCKCSAFKLPSLNLSGQIDLYVTDGPLLMGLPKKYKYVHKAADGKSQGEVSRCR